MTKSYNTKQIDPDIGPVTYLAYDPKTGTHKIKPVTEKFIKGPIPLNWVTSANAQAGKAGSVGIALWFLVGLKSSKTIKLTNEIEKIAACNRQAVYAALKVLEEAGLITVQRKQGARAIVTVLA